MHYRHWVGGTEVKNLNQLATTYPQHNQMSNPYLQSE